MIRYRGFDSRRYSRKKTFSGVGGLKDTGKKSSRVGGSKDTRGTGVSRGWFERHSKKSFGVGWFGRQLEGRSVAGNRMTRGNFVHVATSFSSIRGPLHLHTFHPLTIDRNSTRRFLCPVPRPIFMANAGVIYRRDSIGTRLAFERVTISDR